MSPTDLKPGAEGLIWQEDSAIWEIIAGELVVQHSAAIAGNRSELTARARQRAAEALELIRAGKKDDAGHALIGCSLALGLAARGESAEATPIASYGAELAASVSWESAEPSAEHLEELVAMLETAEGGGATHWELAIRAGAYAAGLSPYITRRRQRRDELDKPGAS